MAKRSKIAMFALVTVLAASGVWAQKKSGSADKLDMLKRLERMLATGRAIIAENQDLFNDPMKGDKEFTADKFSEQLKKRLRDKDGFDLTAELKKGGSRSHALENMHDAMRQVITDAQPLLNTRGMAFKGFLPAVFARKVFENFNERGSGVKGKLTAKVFRNARNAPDEWEKKALEKFLDRNYPHGKAIYETVKLDDGGQAVRYIVPEYYSGACLKCHGEPKGELDITGYKKEGFKDGEPGAALSFLVPLAQ